MYSYYTKTTITRLATRKESNGDHDLYMGYNHCTKCDVCDGSGYVIDFGNNRYLPVFGNECLSDPIECCPQCNPHKVLPRDTCVICAKNRDHVVHGNLYTGVRFSWRYERLVVFNGYLCDQCAQDIESDGGYLK